MISLGAPMRGCPGSCAVDPGLLRHDGGHITRWESQSVGVLKNQLHYQRDVVSLILPNRGNFRQPAQLQSSSTGRIELDGECNRFLNTSRRCC